LAKQHETVPRNGDQAEAAHKHGGMQERRREPQAFVGQRLEPDAIAQRIQKPPFPAKQLERAGDRPGLANELLASGRRRSVEGARPRIEQHAVASPHNPQRDQHIIENRVRRDRIEQRAPDRVDSAGGTDRGVGAALVPADEFLVAPVEADAVAGRRRPGTQHQLAADRADR